MRAVGANGKHDAHGQGLLNPSLLTFPSVPTMSNARESLKPTRLSVDDDSGEEPRLHPASKSDHTNRFMSGDGTQAGSKVRGEVSSAARMRNVA